jgi:hypothetical protein
MFFVVHCRSNREKIILLGNRSKEEILYETEGGESATAQSVSVCKTRKSEGVTVIYGPIPRCKQRLSAQVFMPTQTLARESSTANGEFLSWVVLLDVPHGFFFCKLFHSMGNCYSVILQDTHF